MLVPVSYHLYDNIMISSLFHLLKGIVEAAIAGQRLPQCTIILLLHLPLHCCLFYVGFGQNDSGNVNKTSLVILLLNFAVNVAGYFLLVKLYRHSVKNIFNKAIPSRIEQCIPSFCAHLSLLRPLEIIFRFCTYRWRVLPDVLVLGEVRCGTTSLCEQLASLPSNYVDCHTPFCLWAHPELDNKETFFFVGHYLGNVTPRYYRMCFPLKITKWFSETRWKMLKCIFFWKEITPKPFMTFDGCAQYLTSPSAPYLIAEAYRHANKPLPVLIACVREPAEQALSWWKYENNAIAWGESMGLLHHNTNLRGAEYPPTTIKDAVTFSREEKVLGLYESAEDLFSFGSLITSSERKSQCLLPNWAMTWPGGQLTGVGKNTNFVENISRYEKVFRHVGAKQFRDNTICISQNVHVLPIQHLSNNELLKSFLVRILEALCRRKEGRRQKGKNSEGFEKASAIFRSSKTRIARVHRNSAATSGSTYASIDDSKVFLHRVLDEQSKALQAFCRERNIEWVN